MLSSQSGTNAGYSFLGWYLQRSHCDLAQSRDKEHQIRGNGVGTHGFVSAEVIIQEVLLSYQSAPPGQSYEYGSSHQEEPERLWAESVQATHGWPHWLALED